MLGQDSTGAPMAKSRRRTRSIWAGFMRRARNLSIWEDWDQGMQSCKLYCEDTANLNSGPLGFQVYIRLCLSL